MYLKIIKREEYEAKIGRTNWLMSDILYTTNAMQWYKFYRRKYMLTKKNLICQEFSFCLLCNRISCVAGSHFNFASVMIQFSWNRSLAKRQSAPIHGCIEENMDLGRKTAFLFGRAAVNAALYENCCSLPQLSWQWDIVEAVASNEGQRTSACGFIILDSSTHFECILCQTSKTSESVELHLQELKSQSAASF